MHVLLQRVQPVPVIRGWVRELTASQPVARTEMRVAERACALWAMLGAAPSVLALGGRPGWRFQALCRHRSAGAQGLQPEAPLRRLILVEGYVAGTGGATPRVLGRQLPLPPPPPPPPPPGAFGQQLVAKGVALRRPWAPKAPDAP